MAHRERAVRVFTDEATKAGGCNACTQADADGHYPYRRVVCIELRSVQVRVCRNCLEDLLPQLEDVRQ